MINDQTYNTYNIDIFDINLGKRSPNTIQRPVFWDHSDLMTTWPASSAVPKAATVKAALFAGSQGCQVRGVWCRECCSQMDSWRCWQRADLARHVLESGRRFGKGCACTGLAGWCSNQTTVYSATSDFNAFRTYMKMYGNVSVWACGDQLASRLKIFCRRIVATCTRSWGPVNVLVTSILALPHAKVAWSKCPGVAESYWEGELKA